MADESHLVDGHDVHWHAKQAAQYKAELDVLNPQLNAANARIGELEATGKLLAKEKAEAEKTLQTVATKAAALSEARDRVANELSDLKATLGTVHAENARLKDALDKKNKALAPLVAGLAEQHRLIQAALDAGS